MTPPKARFFDSNGEPLALGLVYTYEAGTSTPKDTYTNAGGGTANSNPVTLDSAGAADIFLSTTGSYKITWYTAASVLVDTEDNIAPFKTGTSDVFSDSTFYLQDNSDATKQLQFQLSGITTGTTTTVTIPNGNTTMVGTDLTQTLSGKTLRNTTITGNSDAIQLKVTANATQTAKTFVVEQSGGFDVIDVDTANITTNFNCNMVQVGNLDVVQLKLKGHSTQTSDIMLIEKADGTDLFKVDNTGKVTTPGYINSLLVTYQATPADPTGTADTTGDMMGLAGSITPRGTGTICITISGSMIQSTNTDGGKVQIRYGTGAAPANADALTGTAVGNLVILNMTTAASARLGWSCNAIVTGLTPATAYWIDVGLAAVTGGTASIKDVSISAFEL